MVEELRMLQVSIFETLRTSRTKATGRSRTPVAFGIQIRKEDSIMDTLQGSRLQRGLLSPKSIIIGNA